MIDPTVVEELIDRALAEDIGFCDLTSELVIPADARAELALNARQDIVVAGIDVAAQVFLRRVPQCRVELRVKDGDRVKAGTAMGRIEGPARGLLAVERRANAVRRAIGEPSPRHGAAILRALCLIAVPALLAVVDGRPVSVITKADLLEFVAHQRRASR